MLRYFYGRENRMKILVTGGAGYIGSVCVAELLSRGHEVLIFDNLQNGHQAAMDPRAQFYIGDLRDKDAIRSACFDFRPQAVIHFADFALVAESVCNPLKYFLNNVGGGINLLQAMKVAKCDRIVFSSSCATYGVPLDYKISECCSQYPINPYGESKLMFEKILSWQSNIKSTCLRYFNAAGAWKGLGEDHQPETHLIPNIIKVALSQKKYVEIYGTNYDTPDGTCIRDYIHVYDLALAHALVIEKEVIGEFNLGTGIGCSVMDVIRAVRAHTKLEIPVKEMPAREGDTDRLVADASLAEQRFGWKPAHSTIDQIVKDAWFWHLGHPKGYQKN